VDHPADNPYVTVVGGTTLTTSSSGAWSSETAWNWGDDTGTGGGYSTSHSIPGWQQALSMTANGGLTSRRNLPDIAMIADNVCEIADNGSGYYVGGTSVASPLWAAFTALINQQAAAYGKPYVGFINLTNPMTASPQRFFRVRYS
jgi:kumamolisin